MYTIYADNVCIHSDVFALEGTKCISPKLVLEDNAAGSLSITLPPGNRGYSTVVRMLSDISVQKDGKTIWTGRVLSETMDFWNNRNLYCEGALSFFNDTTQQPAEYPNSSIRSYIETLLQNHNNNVGKNRQILLGAVTVYDESFPTFYSNYETTLALLRVLIERYGGHMRIREEQNGRYLDYLAEYPNTCSQTIQMGINLLDFTKKWDMSEFATVLIPLGKRLNRSSIQAIDAYLTVESVNDGSPYVISSDALAVYGRIEKTVTWDEIDDASVLLQKAEEYLHELQFDNMVLELSALDLHYLKVEAEAVKLLDEIRVVSLPHGLDRLFPVTKLEIPLDSPENTQFKMGDSVKDSLTSVSDRTNNAILQKIDTKAHSVLEEAEENATAIMHMATTGYITITKDDYGSETLYISNIRDYTKADKLWKWNMNGLGYSKDGGKTYGLAITMDGSIVADYITTGVLNADIIRAGTLKDYDGNFSLDFQTGKLTMKKGSINIGNGDFSVDEEGNLFARRGTFAGTLSGAKGTFGGQLVAASGDFKGIVQAQDFLDASGNSMMKSGRFTSKYLELYGLTVTNKSSGAVTFAVSDTGDVTINGKISMGAGSSIDWSKVGNKNLSSNPAYSLAQDAYDMADSVSVPDYIHSTYIDQTTIRSPTIESNEFNVVAGDDFGSFNLYGSYERSSYHMFTIDYYEGDSPYIDIYSPCSGYIRMGHPSKGIVYFRGIIDFSEATVRGLPSSGGSSSSD